MKTRPIALILLLAIIGFMLAAVTSCSSLSPSTQAKLDAASTQYETTTGISLTQTLGLITQWYRDYQRTKSANTPPAPELPSK